MELDKLKGKHPAQTPTVDPKRAYRTFAKEAARHPLRIMSQRWLNEFYPNVYFNYTDHPLDRNGTAINTPQGYLKKWKDKRAACVLSLEYVRREGNSFFFRGRAYDVYRVVDLAADGIQHTYNTEGKKAEILTLRIDFLRSDVYRLRVAKGNAVPDNATPMVVGDIADPSLEVTVESGGDKTILRTSRMSLHLHHRQFRIDAFDAKGRPIVERGAKTKTEFAATMDSWPLGFVHDRTVEQTYAVDGFNLHPGEAVFGLGERFGALNRVGQTVGMYNYEGLGNTSGRTYKNVPFFYSTRGYGVFYNHTTPMTFWVGTRETAKNTVAIPDVFLDSYFFYGPDPKHILKTYTDLTGKAPVMPLWSYGIWMSRWSYVTEEQVIAACKALREMRMPCDVIHIDTGWFRYDWECDWDFDPKRFPDPARMMKQANELGYRVSLWQAPYVLEDTVAWEGAEKAGALSKNNGPFAFLYMFPGRPIDFSKPEGVAWYKKTLRRLLDMGASVIKVDFGEQVEPHHEFAQYDGDSMHNVYALLYHKAAFEAVEEAKGKGEAILWARAGWAGTQRYPVPWSGDNGANYENMLSSLRGGLSLGICGFTYWSQDTGGFGGRAPDEDLYLRWTQLSIFQSHIRFHAPLPSYNEPWNYTERTQNLVRPLFEFRYRLVPYLYSESIGASRDGLPLLRHLLIEHPNDPTVYGIEDQFYCGRNLLLAPIMEPHPYRRLYLPEGRWYDFHTGELHEGHRFLEGEWPIETFPLYARAGTILPLGPVVQHTGELDYEQLTLVLFPENGKASFQLTTPTETLRFEAEETDAGWRIRTSRAFSDLKVELPGGKPANIASIDTFAA